MSENEENLKGEKQLNISNSGDKSKIIEEQDDNNSIEYKQIKIKKLEEEIESLKNDRKLKKNTHEFIKRILSLCVEFTMFIIALNAIIKFFTDKELYSEWFLSVLIGSQLIILPFSLLFIVAKHLFPNKDK